jgi:hypothetical protein
VSAVLDAITVVGALLAAVGLLLTLSTWHGLDRRMPTQILPRRLTLTLLGAGVALLMIAAAGAAFP